MIRKVAGAILARGWEVFVEDRKTPVLSRRAFLQAMAATGVVAACGSGTPGGTAKISGTITVSYPDELGLKPKYVDQAATALKSRYSGLDVKVDLQKISSGDYYTKLLLALSGGGDVPDVIHVGGDRIGELADAGYIEPLDRYVSQWEDWKNYPDSVKGGVTYQGKVWAIPYGLDMRWLYIRRDVLEKSGFGSDWVPKVVGDIPGVRSALSYYQQAYSNSYTPKELLTTTKPWTSMREKEGKGELALLFE